MERKEKGITLVALTITIVILVILVGVTLRVSVDEKLVETTQNATDNYEQALIWQSLNSILVSERSVYENGFISEQEMWKNIKDTISDENSDINRELSKYGDVEVKEEYYEEDNIVVTGLGIQIGGRAYRMDIHQVTEQ